MDLLIEKVENEKAVEKEHSWKKNIALIYGKTRQKLIPIAMVLGLIYVVLFRTPLVWTMAEPLYINDTPRKADVIVALGAGVGESGRVGQGHEERGASAVKLYNQHFANKILYSSGYRYIMNEAYVMEALSIATGVNAPDIILDETPLNTYEMIMHIRTLAQNYGWKNIIIISSPYHMLRLKFLCDKQLKGINVYFVPVEETSFYGEKGSRVKVRHIRGILHEYAAIIYYSLKGYI